MKLFKKVILFAIATVCVAAEAYATKQESEEIQLTDIAGREVSLTAPAKRILLGEGRFISALGILGIAEPARVVVGMMNDFRLYDPNSFARYSAKFPSTENIVNFGQTTEDSVSVEQMILLDPDLAVFGLEGHGPSLRSSHIIEKLEAAGVPILFIDFRQKPMINTPKSIELLGRALGKTDAANAFANDYRQRLGRIKERLRKVPLESRPNVFLDLRVDSTQPCCFTVKEGLFAAMAQFAGANNVVSDVLTGRVGQVSLEYTLTAKIDFYIGTAFGDPSKSDAVDSPRILSGAGASAFQASSSLAGTLRERGLDSISSVKNKQAYGLWHHFYNSPLNLYAIEKMATWFHPKLFSDLDPEIYLNELLARSSPVDLRGEYSASIH